MKRDCYCKDIIVALFLAGLNFSLSSLTRGSIMTETNLCMLGKTFSINLQVSIKAMPAPAPSSQSTALLCFSPPSKGSQSNVGCDSGHDGQEHGQGCNCKLYPPCVHCHWHCYHSENCWKKFCKLDAIAHSARTNAASSPQTMTITCEEVEHLMKQDTFISSHSSKLASTFAPGIALLASLFTS